MVGVGDVGLVEDVFNLVGVRGGIFSGAEPTEVMYGGFFCH